MAKTLLILQSTLPEALLQGDGADILEGIRRAAGTLQHNALLQEYGHLLEEPDRLRPDVLESLTNAQHVRGPPDQHACVKARGLIPAQQHIWRWKT